MTEQSFQYWLANIDKHPDFWRWSSEDLQEVIEKEFDKRLAEIDFRSFIYDGEYQVLLASIHEVLGKSASEKE